MRKSLLQNLEKTLTSIKSDLDILEKKYSLTDSVHEEKSISIKQRNGFIVLFSNEQSTYLLSLLIRFYFPRTRLRILFVNTQALTNISPIKQFFLAIGAEIEDMSPSHRTSIVTNPKTYRTRTDALSIEPLVWKGPVDYRATKSNLIPLNPLDCLNLLLTEKESRKGISILKRTSPSMIELLLRGLVVHSFTNKTEYPHASQLQTFFTKHVENHSVFKHYYTPFCIQYLTPNRHPANKIGYRLNLTDQAVHTLKGYTQCNMEDLLILANFMYVNFGKPEKIIQDFCRIKEWGEDWDSMPGRKEYLNVLVTALQTRFKSFETEDWWFVAPILKSLKITLPVQLISLNLPKQLAARSVVSPTKSTVSTALSTALSKQHRLAKKPPYNTPQNTEKNLRDVQGLTYTRRKKSGIITPA